MNLWLIRNGCPISDRSLHFCPPPPRGCYSFPESTFKETTQQAECRYHIFTMTSRVPMEDDTPRSFQPSTIRNSNKTSEGWPGQLMTLKAADGIFCLWPAPAPAAAVTQSSKLRELRLRAVAHPVKPLPSPVARLIEQDVAEARVQRENGRRRFDGFWRISNGEQQAVRDWPTLCG